MSIVNWKVVLAIVTCNVVLMSSSYTMLIPFLPLYLSNELYTDPDTVKIWTGAIFAISFAVSAVMSPIWGKMTDKKGKKIMVIRSSSLIALSYLLGGLVQTPLQLLLVRALQGFAAGLWPASLALMSAYCPKNKIGICMGVMQSANICGGILGPLFGGVLAEAFGIRSSFFIAAAALTFITFVTIFFIKEPPKSEKALDPTQPKSSYRALFKNTAVKMLCLSTGMTTFVILLLQPIMTLYIEELLGTKENLLTLSGVVFSLSGIAGAIAAPIWGKMGQAKGFFKTEVISLFAAGILIAAQFIPNTLMPFAILQFCVGLGFSGIFPSANAMIVNCTEPHERGIGFGIIFSAQQVGGAIGPLLGGLMATFINLASIFLISGIILISISLFWYFKAPESMRGHIRTLSSNSSSTEAIHRIKQQVYEEMRQKKN